MIDPRITLGGQELPLASFTMTNDAQALHPINPDWISRGAFEVSGTIVVDVGHSVGWWRPRPPHLAFLSMVRPHMPKRRFRRLRGKVKAATRRARA